MGATVLQQWCYRYRPNALVAARTVVVSGRIRGWHLTEEANLVLDGHVPAMTVAACGAEMQWGRQWVLGCGWGLSA